MTFWTEEKTAELKRRHLAGESGPQIGKALGCSPAAANHKRFRMGLSRPGTDKKMLESRGLGEKLRVRGGGFGNPLGWMSAGGQRPTHCELDEPWRTDGLTILDEAFGGCRWPIGGEGADTRFCCRPAQDTYCAEHQLKSRGKTITPAAATDLERMARRVA